MIQNPHTYFPDLRGARAPQPSVFERGDFPFASEVKERLRIGLDGPIARARHQEKWQVAVRAERRHSGELRRQQTGGWSRGEVPQDSKVLPANGIHIVARSQGKKSA